MTERLPSVSVVIPVRDSTETIEAAVTSVLTQAYGGDLDVILAEGGSSDGSRALVDTIADADVRVRVVDNPGGLTPSGLNAAIRASSGELIVRCDAHAELPSGYVAAAVDRLASTGAGVVGGMQDAVGTTPYERAVAIAMANPLGSGGAAYRTPGDAGPVETVYLGVFRRSVLAEVGLYDESLARNQDYELNHRVADAGHLVFFAPELQVRYRPRGSSGALWRQYYEYGRWKRLVLKREPSSLQLRQLAAPALVIGLAMSAVLALTPARGAATVLPAAYAASVLGAAGVEVVRRRDVAAAAVAGVLPTMHLAWGSGFWRGGTGDPEPQIGRLVE